MGLLAATVIVSSFRPGGIDILLAGMRDQSIKNFEVILVDRRYELRHDRVMKMAKDYGVNLIHVPEFRRNKNWCSFVSAWNTGMALARGEVIILSQDWAYSPYCYVESHIAAVDGKKRYVMAPYCYVQVPQLRLKQPFDIAGQMSRGDHCTEPDQILSGGILDEIACFEAGLFDGSWLKHLPRLARPDQDPRWAPRGVVEGYNWIHVKNESLLRSFAYYLNGLDERLERGKGPMDTDWGNRIRGAGAEFWWEPSAMQFSPNPRFVIRTMPWGDMTERVEGRWSYKDGEAYCARRVREIEAGGSPVALNSYSLEELSVRLDKWRGGELVPLPIDVPDEVYWKGEVPWPDSP